MRNQNEHYAINPENFAIIEVGQRGGKKYRPDHMVDYLEQLNIVFDGTFFYQWSDFEEHYIKMTDKQIGNIIQRQCKHLDYPISRAIEQDTLRTAEAVLDWFGGRQDELISDYIEEFGVDNVSKYEGNLIAFKNGWLNMDKPELGLLKPQIAFLVTDQDYIDVDFKLDLSDDEIQEYNDVMSNFFSSDATIDSFTQTLGYILFSRNMFPPYIFHFYGKGRTGKSLLSDCIQNVLGQYNVSRMSILSLSRQFGQCELIGKRLNIATETETSQQSNYAPIDAELLKKLAGGEGSSTDVKHKGYVTFNNTAKLLFCSNSPFILGDYSSGMTRRIIHYPFTHVQDDNSSLKERMWTDEFKIIFVSQQWFGWTEFSKTKSIKLSKEMITENQVMQNFDTWRAFLNERWPGMSDIAIRQDISSECPSCQELYNEYRDMCHRNGQKELGKYKFYERFRQELSVDDEKVITIRSGSGLYLDVKQGGGF